MPKKKYIVALTPEEQKELEKLTTTGKVPAYKMNFPAASNGVSLRYASHASRVGFALQRLSDAVLASQQAAGYETQGSLDHLT